MFKRRLFGIWCGLILFMALVPWGATAQNTLTQIYEDFSTDPGWDWMNNRVEAEDPPTVHQDFGWSPTNHTSAGKGEIGGTIWRSRTKAYYAMPLGKPLTFKDAFSASGRVTLMPIDKTGGAYIGFFNHARQEWRPWNAAVWRLGDYPHGAEIHVDYMTATWRALGLRTAIILPADGKPHTWSFDYDPDATLPEQWPEPSIEHLLSPRDVPEDQIYDQAKAFEPGLTREELRRRLERASEVGLANYRRIRNETEDAWAKKDRGEVYKGLFTFRVDGGRPWRMFMTAEEQAEPVSIDRFGIFNFQLYGRHWEFYDNESTGIQCEFYLGDLTVNGKKLDLSKDPGWEGVGNRVRFVERDFHGRHNFGFSQTNWAGKEPGEMGGTAWRNEAIDPLHAFYGNDVGKLTLDDPISFEGQLAFIDGGTDGDVFFGYFNEASRMTEFPVEGTQRDYPPDLAERLGGRRNIHLGFDERGTMLPNMLGVWIGGPTVVGYNYSLICTGSDENLREGATGPVIHPDAARRHFTFKYDPLANGGIGQVVATLDDQSITLNLTPQIRKSGALFNRFGIASVRRGGKWVTLYLDDLVYTARRSKDQPPIRHEQKITTVPYPPDGRRY